MRAHIARQLVVLSVMVLSTSLARAQGVTSLCVQSSPPGSCVPVSPANPLPTTGSGGGGGGGLVQQGAPGAPNQPWFMTPGTGAQWAVTGQFWQPVQPVSGTFWQAVQPVSGVLSLSSVGNNGATGPVTSDQAGMVYNATTPTPAPGTLLPLQSDASGYLKVVNETAASSTVTSLQGTTPWITNITQWGGAVVGGATAVGVESTGLVPTVNARVTNSNPNGQATMAASQPVVLASNQAAVPTTPYAYAPAQQSLTTTGQTGTTAVTVLAASGSGTQHEYMTGLQIGRSDTGTTAITATVTDGTKTFVYVVPNNGGGGGNNINFAVPLQFGFNVAVTCAASLPVTTFYCVAQGFNAP